MRSGSVELVIDGRLLDLMGEGEMFGFASLLSEGPLGFVARAAEDTLVYRIPAAVIRPGAGAPRLRALRDPGDERAASACWPGTSPSRRSRRAAGRSAS